MYLLRVPTPERVLVIKQVRRSGALPGTRFPLHPQPDLCRQGLSKQTRRGSQCRGDSAGEGWSVGGHEAEWKGVSGGSLVSGGEVGAQAFEDGMTQADVREYTQMDPWFIEQLWELHQTEEWLKTLSLGDLDAENMRHLKQRGFSDVQIAKCTGACTSRLAPLTTGRRGAALPLALRPRAETLAGGPSPCASAT